MLRALPLLLIVPAFVSACGSDSGRDSLLEGVPDAEIDGSTSDTIFKAAAGDADPAVTEEAAIAEVLDQGEEALEAVLVLYTNQTYPEFASDRLSWAVVIDPATAVDTHPYSCPLTGCPEIYVVYKYAVVDAMSGEILWGDQESGFVTAASSPRTPALSPP